MDDGLNASSVHVPLVNQPSALSAPARRSTSPPINGRCRLNRSAFRISPQSHPHAILPQTPPARSHLMSWLTSQSTPTNPPSSRVHIVAAFPAHDDTLGAMAIRPLTSFSNLQLFQHIAVLARPAGLLFCLPARYASAAWLTNSLHTAIHFSEKRVLYRYCKDKCLPFPRPLLPHFSSSTCPYCRPLLPFSRPFLPITTSLSTATPALKIGVTSTVPQR